MVTPAAVETWGRFGQGLEELLSQLAQRWAIRHSGDQQTAAATRRRWNAEIGVALARAQSVIFRRATTLRDHGRTQHVPGSSLESDRQGGSGRTEVSPTPAPTPELEPTGSQGGVQGPSLNAAQTERIEKSRGEAVRRREAKVEGGNDRANAGSDCEKDERDAASGKRGEEAMYAPHCDNGGPPDTSPLASSSPGDGDSSSKASAILAGEASTPMTASAFATAGEVAAQHELEVVSDLQVVDLVAPASRAATESSDSESSSSSSAPS